METHEIQTIIVMVATVLFWLCLRKHILLKEIVKNQKL